jgi:hypothetical protein
MNTYYFLKNINVNAIYPHIKKVVDSNDKKFLYTFSLENRFKNFIYKSRGIKTFYQILDTSNLTPLKNFQSKNIQILHDCNKICISSKDKIPNGNLFTGLSIIQSFNEKNLPIFLTDNFNFLDRSFIEFLNKEFDTTKLYFNFREDKELVILEIKDIKENVVFIKKYCSILQLEEALRKITAKEDNIFYFSKNENIHCPVTSLGVYKIYDIEDGKIYDEIYSFLLPINIYKSDLIVLSP